MKNLKRITYVLILPLVVVSGLVFANRETKNDVKPSPILTSAERNARAMEDRKKWEASPDGLKYKEWELSLDGKRVHASYDKIRKYIKDFSNMEAIITSVTYRRPNANSSSPKWLIVKIDGEEYMMQFNAKEFESLKSLKVNDKVIVKSHSAGYSPNHLYLIVSGDYIEHNNKVLFKREFNKNGGC
ncbi:hypothetical protein QWY86_19540 [Pedobacter aquatilis]|uniref:hypothetical protein n=1 Tax=Pedobacter aquatilis TaxID=351343 RepID=UPI0025B60F57|nr:hypothetical protein [Pedobacter aquatilis]MDN3588881.1 hypothetical protein [Pedobacter aquatilis]